jgi:HEXXH motif-containing protein
VHRRSGSSLHTGQCSRLASPSLPKRQTLAHLLDQSLNGWLLDAVTVRAGCLGDPGPALHVIDGSDARTVQLVEKLRVSWSILERLSPVHTRWFRRFVRRVVLVPSFGPRASYRHSSRSVFLRNDSATAHDEIGLAAILAHECTHARLCDTAGALVMRPKTRARVEQRCVSEQLDVLLAANQDHYLVAWSRDLLCRYQARIGVR